MSSTAEGSGGPGGSTPTVGVVVPSFRRPELLRRAVDSVRSQTFAPHDVVVVHDEEAVPRELHDLDVRQLATGGGAGPSGARNLGVAAVGGSHLAFLDDDDRWHPAYLATAVAAVGGSGAEMALADVERVRGHRRRPGPPVRPHMTGDVALAEVTGVTGSSILVAREAFERVGGFDVGLPVANDLDFVVRLLDAGTTYVAVPGCLVEYHEHAGERLTTSLRRAEGLQSFRTKWEARLSVPAGRRMDAEVVGIRRRATPGRLRRVPLAMREAWLLGWRETLRRARDLRRWAERPGP